MWMRELDLLDDVEHEVGVSFYRVLWLNPIIRKNMLFRFFWRVFEGNV